MRQEPQEAALNHLGSNSCTSNPIDSLETNSTQSSVTFPTPFANNTEPSSRNSVSMLKTNEHIETNNRQALAYAKALIDGAKKKSAEVLQEACIEAERIRQEAYQQGFESGQHEGLSNLIQLAELIRNRFETFRNQAVALVLAAADEVFAKDVNLSSIGIVERLEHAWTYCQGLEAVQILLSPEDLETFHEEKNEIERRFGPLIKFTPLADPTFHAGRIRIDAGQSSIELDFHEHWARLKNCLLQAPQLLDEVFP